MKILFLGSKRKIRGYGKGYNGDVFITLFKDELSRQHDVLFWGWGYQYNWQNDKSIFEIIDFFGKPDVIMTLCVTDFSKIGLHLIKDIPKIHFVGDVYPTMTEKEYKRHKHLYDTLDHDIYFSPNLTTNECVKKMDVRGKCILWPWSVDTNFFKNYNTNRDIDCCFMGSTWEQLYGNGRSTLKKTLKILKGNNWTKRAYFDDYVDILNRSKIFITNNFKLGYWSKKIMEAMSCGCMLLTDDYPEYEYYGFKDEIHLIKYKTIDEMIELADFYRNNDKRRRKIADAGSKYVRKKFNIVIATEELIEIIQKEIK